MPGIGVFVFEHHVLVNGLIAILENVVFEKQVVANNLIGASEAKSEFYPSRNSFDGNSIGPISSMI